MFKSNSELLTSFERVGIVERGPVILMELPSPCNCCAVC